MLKILKFLFLLLKTKKSNAFPWWGYVIALILGLLILLFLIWLGSVVLKKFEIVEELK